RVILPPQWEIEDAGSSYAAPVDALAFNENVVGVFLNDCTRPVIDTDPLFVSAIANVTCGEARAVSTSIDPSNAVTISGSLPSRYHSVSSIANPALYAAQALASALKHAG